MNLTPKEIVATGEGTARPVLGALWKSDDITQGWPVEACPVRSWCDSMIQK